jgi:hypothetical protein
MKELISDLWSFAIERKKFWLIPIIIFSVIFGFLIILGESSIIAPFIYTIF